MQLLIYSPQVSPRVKYTFNFIFREVLRCDFEFTSLSKTFIEYAGPKFSYAKEPLFNELFFCSHGLLTSTHIDEQKIEFTTFGNEEVPFAVVGGALPFDVFAASFYFLSRYEEYLPFTADNHGRYPAKQSLQFKLGLLKKPIIDQWALVLKNILLTSFNNLKFGEKHFDFIPTIDIDRAYHFKSSGIFKNTLRVLVAIFKRDKERLTNIITTGLRKKKDPYDTYHFLNNEHDKHKAKPIFFFLLSQNGNKEHDVNIDPSKEILQNLIIETAKHAEIGIHPSYSSNNVIAKLKTEKATLEKLLDKKIVASRQHYLKLHLPTTYLQLIEAKIYHDYTMGYASEIGFRAGTCTPFFWYDLRLEKQSHLKVHPFGIMDVSLQQYAKLTPAQAITEITEMINSVKLVNGTFYSLWHNESLSETANWKGWQEVYIKMLEIASS